jgi:hypothetical protein
VAIFRKELADHFSSARFFLLLLGLVVMVSLITSYLVGASLREEPGRGHHPQVRFCRCSSRAICSAWSSS